MMINSNGLENSPGLCGQFSMASGFVDESRLLEFFAGSRLARIRKWLCRLD